jgi:hypothetical protein
MFLSDLGEGHMETFDQSRDMDLNVNFHFDFTPNIAFISKKHFFQDSDNNSFACTLNYDDQIPIIRRFFLANIDFRGPPCII